MTVFGAGILIGTALTVIIPEGLEMWSAARESAVHDHNFDHESHQGINGEYFLLLNISLTANGDHINLIYNPRQTRFART